MVEITVISVNDQAKKFARNIADLPPCFAKLANSTSKNIKISTVKMPNTAILGSNPKPKIIATTAPRPATAIAYRNAGTAFFASNNISIGDIMFIPLSQFLGQCFLKITRRATLVSL